MEIDKIKLLAEDAIEDIEKLSWVNIKELAIKIVEIIPILPNATPLLISGDWGSGKTSLLKSAKNEIGEKQKCLWFDAWKYEQEQMLLPALINVISSSDDSISKDLIKRVRNISLLVATRFIGMLPGSRSLTVKSIKEDLDILDNPKAIDTPLSDLLSEYYEELINNILKGESDEKLIVFIDDLDRCSPEQALNLIEAIRFLINQNQNLPVCFIVIMDKAALAQTIKGKFDDINSYDSNRFLEKIFPIMLSVPNLEIDDIGLFIRAKFQELNLPKAMSWNDSEKETQLSILIRALSSQEFANPRLIKRCMNRLSLLLYFNKGKNDNYLKSENNMRNLISWMAATERWPILRKQLRNKQDEYWQKLTAVIKNGTGINDQDAEEILQLPGFKDFFIRSVGQDAYSRIKAFKEAEKLLVENGL